MERQPSQQDQFSDCYRIGLEATGDLIKSWFESAERLRQQQFAVVHEALVSHARVVAEIDHAKVIGELIGVSGKLARLPYQAAIGCWSGIFLATGASQAEVARRAQAQAEQIRASFQKTLIAAPGAAVPAIVMLQPLMDLASSVYAPLDTPRRKQEGTPQPSAH